MYLNMYLKPHRRVSTNVWIVMEEGEKMEKCLHCGQQKIESYGGDIQRICAIYLATVALMRTCLKLDFHSSVYYMCECMSIVQ